jgi:hypothetical protein
MLQGHDLQSIFISTLKPLSTPSNVLFLSLGERLQMGKHENVSLRSAECLFCKYLIGYIDTAVQNNRTPAAIEAELEKVCNILPASLKENCTVLVKRYGPIIAFLLATNATPEHICNVIKLCNNGTQQITSGEYATKLNSFLS